MMILIQEGGGMYQMIKKNNITLGVFGGILLVYVSFCEYAYKYLPHNTKKYNFLKSAILDMKESSKWKVSENKSAPELNFT